MTLGLDGPHLQYSSELEEADWGNAAGAQCEEAFWLLGSEAVEWQKSLERNTVASAQRSALHPDSGVAILRSGDKHCTFTIGGDGRPRSPGIITTTASGWRSTLVTRPCLLTRGRTCTRLTSMNGTATDQLAFTRRSKLTTSRSTRSTRWCRSQ